MQSFRRYSILVIIVILFCSTNPPEISEPDLSVIYRETGLDKHINYQVFQYAFHGYASMKELKKKDILTIIDFSKPSTEERLFIVDVRKKKLLASSLVAHGKNSGDNYASSFSNTSRSLKSSLGFYRTAEIYQGKHGYSLRLDGLEDGINNNARERAIVIHGAAYVSEDFIEKYGRLGRSWGCPSVPVDEAEKLIDLISGGSCLFIYADYKDYLENSTFINLTN